MVFKFTESTGTEERNTMLHLHLYQNGLNNYIEVSIPHFFEEKQRNRMKQTTRHQNWDKNKYYRFTLCNASSLSLCLSSLPEKVWREANTRYNAS